MTAEPTTTAFAARLENAATTDAVRAVLRDIYDLPKPHSDGEKLRAIEVQALEILRRILGTPHGTVTVLGSDLLPLVLGQAEDDTRGPRPTYSEIFADWLGRLPFDHQADVRQVVLPAALKELAAGRVVEALRVIGRVGYADPDVCDRLEVLGCERDDELADRVLNARAELGMRPGIRALIRDTLHRRLQSRFNLYLVTLAWKIGNATTMDYLFRAWCRPLEQSVSHWADDGYVLSALVGIVARDGSPQTASDFLHRVRDLAGTEPERPIQKILDSGGITKVPAAHVVLDLVRRLGGEEGGNRWATYYRLKECIQPIHSNGWAAVESGALEPVREDAVRGVKQKGQFKTIDLTQKEDAWGVLLSVGRLDALPPMDQAIRSDPSGFVKHEFLELAACIGVTSLPTEIPDLLAGPPAAYGWGQDEALIAQIGAIRAAHGAMSDEAFAALLGYRPVGGGGILLSAIGALADIAAIRSKGGDRSFIARLLIVAETSGEASIRALAGAALSRLLEDGQLTADEASRLGLQTLAPSTDAYNRRAVLHAFVIHAEIAPPQALLAFAADLTRPDRLLSDEERRAGLVTASLTFRALFVSGDELATLQAEQFGVLAAGGQLQLQDGQRFPAAGYYVVGRWYTGDPPRYGPVVAALLRRENATLVVPLVAAVRQVGPASPREVGEALQERVHRMDAGRIAEPKIIEALADVAPSRFLADPWPALERWMPEARVAFVEALGRLHGLSDPEATVREQLLIRLAGDGQFGVRRAASRVFAEVEPVRYEALLASWAAGRNQDTAERRRQAAEGTLWVRSSGALDQLRELEWDREEAVRKAYQRATDDRREAGWREFHESHVLAATAAGDVVRMWRHGWALGRLGDDRTIERLNQRASTDLPANVRFWVERVRKEVQGRWDDVVRKWPEPWYARRGRYEVVDGTILWADGSSTGIQAHLWVDVGDRPSGLAGWGGWGDLDGSTRASWLKRSFTRLGHGGEDQLLIPGRAPARILVTSSLVPDGRIVFTGNSFYPQEGNASDPA